MLYFQKHSRREPSTPGAHQRMLFVAVAASAACSSITLTAAAVGTAAASITRNGSPFNLLRKGQQIVFDASESSSSTLASSSPVTTQPLAASALAAVHLSHTGLFVNHAHLDYVQEGVSQPLTLYVDPQLYDVQRASLHVSHVHRRAWDDVAVECSYSSPDAAMQMDGGIEACEKMDLSAALKYFDAGQDQEEDHDMVCPPSATTPDGRAIFGSSHAPPPVEHTPDTPSSGPPRKDTRTQACKMVDEFLGRRKRRRSGAAGQPDDGGEDAEPRLHSMVVTVHTPRKSTAHSSSSRSRGQDIDSKIYKADEIHHFWLSHLFLPDAYKARWPLAGNAHSNTSGKVEPWTGRNVNRIAGLPYDPFISSPPLRRNSPAPPSGYDPAKGTLDGVGIVSARWNTGVSIRSPFNTRPNDPVFEPVHAPVAGQIVWAGHYSRGPGHKSGARQDTERGYMLMIRDEWGFVWQIAGVEEETLRVHPGDDIFVGQVVADVRRQGATAAAEASAGTRAAADPYRFKSLRITVARPDVTWTRWPAPFVAGWTFYDPMAFFLEDTPLFSPGKRTGGSVALSGKEGARRSWRSSVPPYANPNRIFFARPALDPLTETVSAFASSTDLLTPTLSGKVQIIVSFDSYVQTPGDGGDAMDGTGLYSLQWGLMQGQQDRERDWDPEACEFFGHELDGSEWRVAFEHDKMVATPEPGSNGTEPTSVFAHIVPSFTYGTFFKTKYHSAFDHRERHVFYTPTRRTRGQADLHGSWDTRKEPNGNGFYTIIVRATDFWGNVGCVSSKVYIRNRNIDYGLPDA
ncbi:hypothetical protein K437DRAFT_293183 [Tilletiaria anomala UBC 951]|uniref:Uncharacterized protein n=1 Tax=Tilletiaria anomala (strain ATCC 24038 / CBS 436.72 / UBC 951) TaxID=1037660 RepID=A0A066WI98_TILAU|nr:uncharacterized protein K437DRAFT_293183 [Tilletiaria anomala UBC 951]KDN52253.1 hypothetical protein K437DRAFT_293183 [Tilletiaria anomala UBC 951]